jgi:hypothetical protein
MKSSVKSVNLRSHMTVGFPHRHPTDVIQPFPMALGYVQSVVLTKNPSGKGIAFVNLYWPLKPIGIILANFHNPQPLVPPLIRNSEACISLSRSKKELSSGLVCQIPRQC